MVENANWNPNIDLMVPNPDAIPYPGFGANQVFSPMLLKTPLELTEGDTLTIGVHSADNEYGEVVLALTGMLWTAHCTPEPEDMWGCKEVAVCNFDPFAGCDDGSCAFSEPSVDITTHPWSIHSTPNDECSSWSSSFTIQLEPDGTAWYVFLYDQHPLFGQPQPCGVWSMCGDQFYLYGTAEPFSFQWNGSTYPMNPNNNVWTGTFIYGPTASQIEIWSDGYVAHIAGTASNAETGDNWCFEMLWRVIDCMDPVAYNYNV